MLSRWFHWQDSYTSFRTFLFSSQSFFKLLDSIIMPFIWGCKAHRISKTHLQKPREKGGFGLPCFQHYYWANLRAFAFWGDGYNLEISTSTPAWVAIEKKDIKDSSLPALLFSTPGLPNTKVKNRIIINCLKIYGSKLRSVASYLVPVSMLQCVIIIHFPLLSQMRLFIVGDKKAS